MKPILSCVAIPAVVGVVAGAAVGFWEARPWTAGRPIATPGEENPGAAPTPAASAGAPGSRAPQLVVQETTFKFGNMETGAVQRHTFPVRNEGDGPLTINYVSHTCKCTTVALNDQEVQPGAEITVPPKSGATVMLEWTAKTPPGPFRHGASFTTNDPLTSRLEFTVEGEIVGSDTLEPDELSFGAVPMGQLATAELFVMAFQESEVEITSHLVSDPRLAEKITIAVETVPPDKLPNRQAKAGVKVVATYDPRGMLGPFGGSLSLQTNLARSPKVEVPIRGRVKGDISIFGNLWNETAGLLRMAPVTSAQGGASQLNINVRGAMARDTEFSVESVDPPELRVTLGERREIRPDFVRIPLEVSVPPGTPALVRAGDEAGGEGEIILSTTHPTMPKVRLRVQVVVRP